MFRFTKKNNIVQTSARKSNLESYIRIQIFVAIRYFLSDYVGNVSTIFVILFSLVGFISCNTQAIGRVVSKTVMCGQAKYPSSVLELNLQFPNTASSSHFGAELLRTKIKSKQRTIYISLALRSFYFSLCEFTERLDNGDDALKCSLRNSQRLAYLLTIA